MTIFNNSCIFYYIFLMPCCGILLRHFALYINLSQHRWADFFCLGLATEPNVLRAGLFPGLPSVCPSRHRKQSWTSRRAPASSKSCCCCSHFSSDVFSLPGQLFSNIPSQVSVQVGERHSTVGPLFPPQGLFAWKRGAI